jgi:hypothetical protein
MRTISFGNALLAASASVLALRLMVDDARADDWSNGSVEYRAGIGTKFMLIMGNMGEIPTPTSPVYG